MDTEIRKEDLTVYPLRKFYRVMDFACEHKDFTKFLAESAIKEQEQNSLRIWLFIYKEQIVGYVGLSMNQLSVAAKKKFKTPVDTQGHPALLITHMARDECYKGKCLGTYMLEWVVVQAIELSQKVGCRCIIARAEPNILKLYKKFGFAEIPGDEDEKLLMYDIAGYHLL